MAKKVICYNNVTVINILAGPNASPGLIFFKQIPLLKMLIATPQLNEITTNKQSSTLNIEQWCLMQKLNRK